MKALVIGAGAVGGWIGGHLARSGHWVTLVGRSALVEAVQARGFEVVYPSGQRWVTRNLRAVETIAEAMQAQGHFHAPPYDAALVCVKAYDVAEVVEALRETDAIWSGAAAPVVTFQNGVGSEEQFAAAFGAARVIAGTLTSPVSVVAPGGVRLARAGGGIGLAPCDGPLPDVSRAGIAAALKQPSPDPFILLLDALRQTMLRVEAYADYRAMKWSKLLLNIVSNASSAILDLTPAQVYADPRLFCLEMRMLREALAVARAAGIRMVNLPGVPAAWLAGLTRALPDWALRPVLRRTIARGRGDKMPSFYYDVPRAGAVSRSRCEVAWLNGAVAARGRQLGIATPVNAALTEVLTDLVTGRDDPAAWAGQVDRLVGVVGRQ
jgi:2-dehydropantoate 2-reductase